MIFFFVCAVLTVSSVGGKILPHKESCSCFEVYDPVCGSDFVTYGNECEFNCAKVNRPELSILSRGPCQERHPIPKSLDDEGFCMCTSEFRPVCGSDGITYGNICEFECERHKNPTLAVAHFGTCTEEGLPMPELQIPLQHLKPIPYNRAIVKRSYETCPCTREYQPFCGSDHITYSNRCEFRCAAKQVRGLHIMYEGTCKD